MKHSRITIIALLCALIQVLEVTGASIKIVNEQSFVDQLKSQKRVVAFIIDTTQLKDMSHGALIDQIANDLSDVQEYRLSRLGFITVDLAHLPQTVQSELRNAIGGTFKEPLVVALFENGSLQSGDGLFISTKDLQAKIHDVTVGIGRLIEQHWGSYIEHCLYKCNNADARREFAHAKKMQVSLVVNMIDQNGYYVDNQYTNYYDNGSYDNVNYDPALYGYGEQPAYQNSTDSVYYNYPYYNSGYVPAVGLGLGVGLGAAGLYGGNYYRGGYYGHNHGGNYHHHGGGYRHAGHGGFHGGGRGGHGRR